MNRIERMIIIAMVTFTLISLILIFVPSLLGYDLLVQNGNALSAINITKSINSSSFRESLLCSVSLMIVPLVEIIVNFAPINRERSLVDLFFKLIRVLTTLCPHLIMATTSDKISYVSLFPAIFAAQQSVLLLVFSYIYIKHGSPVWRPQTVCAGFVIGWITIYTRCYSAYFFSTEFSIVAICMLGITAVVFTLQFALFITYIYKNYIVFSKELSKSDYICCIHISCQELYVIFLFAINVSKNGVKWQDSDIFEACAHVYLLAGLNALLSVFYDRLVERDLSWTQVI